MSVPSSGHFSPQGISIKIRSVQLDLRSLPDLRPSGKKLKENGAGPSQKMLLVANSSGLPPSGDTWLKVLWDHGSELVALSLLVAADLAAPPERQGRPLPPFVEGRWSSYLGNLFRDLDRESGAQVTEPAPSPGSPWRVEPAVCDILFSF